MKAEPLIDAELAGAAAMSSIELIKFQVWSAFLLDFNGHARLVVDYKPRLDGQHLHASLHFRAAELCGIEA